MADLKLKDAGHLLTEHSGLVARLMLAGDEDAMPFRSKSGVTAALCRLKVRHLNERPRSLLGHPTPSCGHPPPTQLPTWVPLLVPRLRTLFARLTATTRAVNYKRWKQIAFVLLAVDRHQDTACGVCRAAAGMKEAFVDNDDGAVLAGACTVGR